MTDAESLAEKTDNVLKAESAVKTYSVFMIDASAFDGGGEWWMHGFPTQELATEFARRWVRSCVEEARRDLSSPLAWRQVGENAISGQYNAGDEAEFFAMNPATPEEVDWQAVKREAGLD